MGYSKYRYYSTVILSLLKGKKKNILYHHLNNVNNKRLPPFKNLRKSIIHNDGNDHNIILNKDGSLKGIIDFGDIIHSFTVLDAQFAWHILVKKIKNL